MTAAFKAVSSATADLIYKWQARNKDKANWVDLMTAVTITNPSTTYQETTYSGRFPVEAGKLDSMPIEVRLILQCNETDEGRAKVKNSSYVKLIWTVEG